MVVTILDVNDNKPDISNLPQRISVSEGKPPGSVVFVLRANDKDQGKKKKGKNNTLPSFINLFCHQ